MAGGGSGGLLLAIAVDFYFYFYFNFCEVDLIFCDGRRKWRGRLVVGLRCCEEACCWPSPCTADF